MALKYELFSLIKSMSRGEKRAFSLYVARYQKGEQNRYKQLFYLIDQQEEYDEDAVKEAWDAQGIRTPFTLVKHKLLSNLLSSLRQLHESELTPMQLRRDEDIILLLMRRGLHEEACARMVNLMEYYWKREAYESWLTVFNRYRPYFGRRDSDRSLFKEVKSFSKQAEHARQCISHKTFLHNIISEIELGLRKSESGQEDADLTYLKLSQHPALRMDQSNMSSEAYHLIRYARMLLALGNRDYETAYQQNIAQLKWGLARKALYEKDCFYIRQAFRDACHHLRHLGELHYHDELQTLGQKLKQKAPLDDILYEIAWSEDFLLLRILKAFETRNLKVAFDLSAEFKQIHLSCNKFYYMTTQSILCWEYARWSFITRRRTECKAWSAMIERLSGQSKDVLSAQAGSRMLTVMLLWEAGAYQDAEKKAATTRRFMRSKSLLQEDHALFFRYLRRLSIQPQNAKILLSAFAKELQKINRLPGIFSIDGMNLRTWVASQQSPENIQLIQEKLKDA